MFGLALAYLRDRALTTWLNIVLLALAVATLVILLLVSTQIGERFERDARGVDLVVGAKGSPLQLILSSVYHVDMPTGNIPLESVELLRRNRSVAEVIPLALGDSFRGYRIVGTLPCTMPSWRRDGCSPKPAMRSWARLSRASSAPRSASASSAAMA
jgi:putative ABC transport system permease protein